MAGSTFVYVTLIRTSPDKLWSALTDAQTMREYWFGMHQDSSWEAGSPWRLVFEDGRVADAGEIIEAEPPRRLVIKWRNEWKPEMAAEGYSRCVYEIEAAQNATKLTVTHSMERDNAKFIEAVSGGWPWILSNLKSLLETGQVVMKDRPA